MRKHFWLTKLPLLKMTVANLQDLEQMAEFYGKSYGYNKFLEIDASGGTEETLQQPTLQQHAA